MDEIRFASQDTSQIPRVIKKTPKTNAERGKAFRERKKLANASQTPTTSSERGKAFRERQKQNKAAKMPPKTNSERGKAFRDRQKQLQASQTAGPSSMQQLPVHNVLDIVPIKPVVYDIGKEAQFTPGGPDSERIEIEAEVYCHGNPAQIALTPGELLAIRPQKQKSCNRYLPGQVSDYILINNKVIIDNF